jgi:hypothetical protein
MSFEAFIAEWIRIVFFRDVMLCQWVGNIADILKEDSGVIFRGIKFCTP